MKKEENNPIILDAGDLIFSTPIIHDSIRASEELRAFAMLEGYERIGCNAINVGQYELTNGLHFLLELSKSTDILFISANLRDSKTNELLFEPYIIIEKPGLTLGIIGLVNIVETSGAGITVDDYIATGQSIISNLRKKVDQVIVLINTPRSTHKELPHYFKEADLIYTSGSTNMTRPMMKQLSEGPFVYSTGREGRYLNVTRFDIKEKIAPLINVSYLQENMKYTQRKLDRLQGSDSEKTLEEIYADQDRVLEKIKENRKSIANTQSILKHAVNTLHFDNVPMDAQIEDDNFMLNFVNSTLLRYEELKNK